MAELTTEQKRAIAIASARMRMREEDPEFAKNRAAIEAFAKSVADPTADMGFLEKMRAGAGKAFSDLGSGAAQLVGAGPSADEVRETRQRDAALMNTGAGMTGNVLGNVAALAPAMMIPGANTVAGATLIGAGSGMLQPAESALDRGKNMALGGGLGAGLQTASQYPHQIYEGAKNLVRKPIDAVMAAVEPLYAGGRDKIVSRALAEATGTNRNQVISNLRNAQEIVPGSLPTAAETGQSGGLAAMQRAAAAVDPEAYATRAAQQNEARLAALQGVSGTDAQRTAAVNARESTAGGLYRQAREAGVDPEMGQVLQPQINNLMERMPPTVLNQAKDLARLNGEVIDSAGSLNGLHYSKLAIDDMIASAAPGSPSQRGLLQLKNDLLTVMDDLSPAYAQGRQQFRALSRPINQMDVGRAIEGRAVNPLTRQVQPQQFARALSDDTAAAATGFDKATLSNTMEPQQLASLNALKEDLARSVAARDLGRGVGSDTTQKLSMTNLMERSGLPMGVLNVPGLGRAGNWLYQGADQQMKERLARALLDPKETARIMALHQPYQRMGAPSQLTRDRASAIARAILPASVAGASE